MSNSDSLLFENVPCQDGHFLLITLNRPQALNALTHEMFRQLDALLADAAKDSRVQAVVLRANGERAFSAGGDIRYVHDHARDEYVNTLKLFWDEYRLNHHIYHYPKPYLSLLHGVTMGGGVGVSIHGSHRVGCESLVFAMPETGIGFFPDIGASYFLSRMKDSLGIYLGLTGSRLKSADALYAGVIDHFVEYAKYPEILQQLSQTNCDKVAIDKVLTRLASYPGPSPIAQHQLLISECFKAKTVEDVIANLTASDSTFASDTLQQLRSKSPTALKVTMEQLHRGAHMDFDECMRMEYRLVTHFLTQPDVFEGVRAAIIDKDNKPQWNPNQLDQVSPEDVARYFTPSTVPDLHFFKE